MKHDGTTANELEGVQHYWDIRRNRPQDWNIRRLDPWRCGTSTPFYSLAEDKQVDT